MIAPTQRPPAALPLTSPGPELMLALMKLVDANQKLADANAISVRVMADQIVQLRTELATIAAKKNAISPEAPAPAEGPKNE